MQGQKATVRLSVGHSNDNVLFERHNAIGIKTLSEPTLGTARQFQEGDIDRFKGCSHVPGSEYPFQVTLNTFTPFASNNFIGNDRNRPAYSFGPSGINPGPSAHCGVLSGIFLPAGFPLYPPPPPMIQLAAAGNYWGSANGPSSTGPGDAVGGACAQLNTSTLATPFAKTPFPVSSNP
jgi:hypothetical protein